MLAIIAAVATAMATIKPEASIPATIPAAGLFLLASAVLALWATLPLKILFFKHNVLHMKREHDRVLRWKYRAVFWSAVLLLVGIVSSFATAVVGQRAVSSWSGFSRTEVRT